MGSDPSLTPYSSPSESSIADPARRSTWPERTAWLLPLGVRVLASCVKGMVRFNVASKLHPFLDKSQFEVSEKASEIDECRSFYKDNARIVSKLVGPAEVAMGKLHSAFPVLADRVFWHDEEARKGLEEWTSSALPNHGKHRDKNDETVDHTGALLAQIKEEEMSDEIDTNAENEPQPEEESSAKGEDNEDVTEQS